jgi:hypothetical protein
MFKIRRFCFSKIIDKSFIQREIAENPEFDRAFPHL